jgi:ATP-dependent helicase/nuclease subunit B
VPSENEARAFHLQLPLEAAIAGPAASTASPRPGRASRADRPRRRQGLALDPALAPETLDGLARLLAAYLETGTGFTARLRPQRITFAGDYDHLARLGEWADGDAADPEPVA